MATRFGGNYPAHPIIGRRNNKERYLFAAAAGVFFALLITVVAVVNFKNQANARQEIEEALPTAIGSVMLLTPASTVRAGTRLSEVRFRNMPWPRNQVPPTAVTDFSEIKDLFAKDDLPANMPIQRLNLSKEPVGMTLPLTPGNRAVSIEINDVSGIEGHALPGTNVDVVLTSRDPDGTMSSKIIVQYARVLSTGGDITPAHRRRGPQRGSQVRHGKTLTLDVSPEEALKIETAKELGRLSLLMRSHDDTQSPAKTKIDESDVDNSRAKPTKARAAQCNNGRMKIDGADYIIGCDGSLHMIDPFDP